MLVITYTEARRGRAARAGSARRSSSAAGTTSRGARRRLDLDDPRLLHPAAEGVSVRGRARPALPRARRAAGGGAPRRGVRRGARPSSAPASEPERLRLLATYGARRAAADADRRLRDAALGRAASSSSSSASRPTCRRGVEELREAARCLADDAARPTPAREARPRCSTCSAREPRARAAARPLAAPRVAASAPRPTRRRASAVEQAALDELAAARPRRCCRSCSSASPPRTRPRRTRESALDFEDLQLAARDLLRDHADDPRARAAALPLDHGRRVPGHEPAPVRARRPARRGDGTERFFVGDEFQSIYGFRHADVGVFRERRAEAPQVLALTRNYRSRPEVLAAVNELFGSRLRRRVPAAARPRASSPTRSSGSPVELLVTDKASYAGSGTHWRRAEAQHDRAARARARRRGRRDAGRDRAPVRGRHRRRVVRGGAARAPGCRPTARPAAATSASSRSSTCSPTCACCTTATTTRRCSPCSRRRSSASRTTRSC